MARPCWMATTRLVVNDRPSRMRSTSYRIGAPGSPGRRKYECREWTRPESHGATGGDESLGRDLAAEHALTGLVEIPAAEDVDFYGLEVENVDQLS